MNIRPRIPKFQYGGIPEWYLKLYKQHALTGWNNNLDKRFANNNLNLNGHYNAGDLSVAYEKNRAYTSTPEAVTLDIQSFYDSDGSGMSAKEYENFYNTKAGIIRSHWNADLTYGKESAGIHNPLYSRMFKNRSNQNLNLGDVSGYNIGYQTGRTRNGYNIENIEGSSTWLRRMDRYEKDDLTNPDRIHEITLKDGTKARYYKENNGDIRLLEDSPNNPPSLDIQQLSEKQDGGTEVGGNPFGNKNPQQQGESALDRLRGMLPGLLSTGRLAGNLINNERVYDEALKGIRPTLIQPYYTHRQVVGDEATKLAYYRRAAQGLTKASRPFTSDADRQMAYMQEARRVGDELRALGDLADNQEIRRTSDESNQHQWANTLRATEVANTNLASLNDANEKKHTLLAQKHSAQWSSIDNYLKEIEYRKRLLMEEDNAFNKLIDLLSYLTQLESDTKLKEAQDELWKLAKYDSNNNPTWDSTDPAVKAALEKLKLELARVVIQSLRYKRDVNRKYSYSPFFIKSGSKITYKKKDDLLYKSTKDVVDHFRKMCRRYPEKERKIQPLAPHPDGTRRKKYQTGGQFLAPFTVYTPVVGTGGETSRTVTQDSSGSTKASSSKDTTLKDMLDLIKMFKDIKGIKVDVSSIYANIASILLLAELFGKEISSLQMATMYLRAMLQLNNVSRSKEIYDEAYKRAVANDALNEIAVNSVGYYAVQNKDTKDIEYVKEIDLDKYTPLTNSLLLTFREFSPNLSFEKGDLVMLNVIANGIGINKIGKEIKELVGKLSSTEESILGLSKTESGKIKAGLEILSDPLKVRQLLSALLTAPDGDYKYTVETKNQINQMKLALNYLKNVLPDNYKAVMNMHGGVEKNIMYYLGSISETTNKFEISPLTGKAASKDDKDSSEKIKSNPLMLLIQGEGGVPRTWNLITKDSNVKMSVDGIEYPQLPKITEDMSLDKMLSESGIAGILDSKQGITFGDLNILPDLFKDIMYSNSGGMVVTLPCKIVNGHKEVNLGVKRTYEEAIQEVESKGLSKNSPEYYKILGEVLKQKGLNSLLDSNGYPDRNKFGQFLVVEAYTTDKIKNLDTSSQYIEKVKNPDALLEERMIKALSTDSKKSNYNLDIDYWLYGDNVYRGTVFIPLNNNLNAAINASGSLISVENARELENKFQNFNKASNMKSSNSDVL